MSEEQVILVSAPAEHVKQITINRPKALNALNGAVLAGIGRELESARDDDAVRAVVLTGDERAFAAGADIKEFPTQAVADVLMDQRGRLWNAIWRFPKPIIAAVNGFALGGGCEIAMGCDIIIAGENARFGQPEVNLGIIPGAGGTQRLPRAVGKSLAMKMILAAEFIDARTALASTIASKPPLAVRVAKELVLRSFDVTVDNGLDFERRANAALFGTEDKREGVAAFIEKRKGRFRGR